ncbi:synaptonemal complex protein 2-like isoform X3 [Vanacampus margaritifer]
MLEMEMEACLSRGDSSRMACLLREEGLRESTLTQLGQRVHKLLSSDEFGKVAVVLKALEILFGNDDLKETLVNLGITHQVTQMLCLCALLVPYDKRAPNLWIPATLEPAAADGKLLRLSGGELLDQSCLSASELSLILVQLLNTLLESQLRFSVRVEAVRTFNSILHSLGKNQKKRVRLDQTLLWMMYELGKTMETVGGEWSHQIQKGGLQDYELQVSLVEALCYMTPRKDRVHRANRWFSCSDIADAFGLIKAPDFEVDCRHFLNFLNDRQGKARRVWTFPCISAFLETTELIRPQNDKWEEFWVDFNFGSQCVSFFIDLPQGFLWGSVHLLKEDVDQYRLEVQEDEGNGDQAVLSVRLKVAIMHMGVNGHRVKLLFRPELLGELKAAAAGVFTGEQEAHKDSGDNDQASTSPTQRPLGQKTYRKKPLSTRLKVLPMSPMSSDDAAVAKTSQSRAETLFDQVVGSMPLKDSGAEPESSQEDNFGQGCSLNKRFNRKRAAADSGCLSDECDTLEGPQPGEHQPQGAEPAGSPNEPSEEPHGIESTSMKGEEPLNPQEAERQLDSTSTIKNSFGVFTRSFEHDNDCWQEARAQILLLPEEYKQEVASLFDDISQQRAVVLHSLAKSMSEHMKRLEETSTYLNNMCSRFQVFIQSEKRKMSDFCERHHLMMRSLDTVVKKPRTDQ